MSTTSTLLFAYGTLIRGLPFHHLIDGRAEFVAFGTIGGTLVDLGGFPGALPDGRRASDPLAGASASYAALVKKMKTKQEEFLAEEAKSKRSAKN